MELFSLMAKLTLDADEFNNELESAESALEDFDEPESPVLGLDNSEFNDNIEESSSLGSGFEQSMSTAFGNVAKALTAAGIVGTLAGIVNWLKQAIDMTAETADGIDKGSKRLGISTKAYQEWDHALKQSGASISDLNKGIRNMQKLEAAASAPYDAMEHSEDIVDGLAEETVKLGDDAANAFKRLGISAKVASGELSGTEEIMEATLLALAGYTGDDRSLLVRALFGNNADGLNALLDEGEAGVKDLLSEASDLGLIMDQKEIDNAVAYGDAVANLQAELDAIKSAFVADIIPQLTSAVEWLTQFLAKLNPRKQKTSLEETLININDEALKAGSHLDEAGESAKAFIKKLSDMGDYWTLDDEGQKTWDALAQEFIDEYPQFAECIDLENKKINENTETINANIDAWVARQKQMIIDNALADQKAAIAAQEAKVFMDRAKAVNLETKADQKRAKAMAELNSEFISNRTLQQAYIDKFHNGVTVDSSNIDAVLDWLLNEYQGGNFDTSRMESVDEWRNMKKEAQGLREEADTLEEEAENAKADLESLTATLEEQFSKSQTSVEDTTKAVEALTKALLAVPKNIAISLPIFGGNFKSHAIGSNYIPYDNYPALLHRGERVLTSTEARQQNVDLSGLEDRIEAAIRNGMEGATVHSYINGRDITDEVNRNNIQAVKGRRFSG